jgi:ABC-2 type transport system ATP-binding protein
MLTTLLPPTAGRATVAGFDVAHHGADVRRHIGAALQETALDNFLTGREHMDLHAGLNGLPKAERSSRGTELLERVGLTEAADRKVGGYSGGMKRRLDLALALVHRPQVLFLDEPTTGLDPTSRAALWREVRSLNEDGTTVFLTTQYLEEAEQLADRVGIIASGRLVAEGTPAVLKSRVGEPTLHVELADEESAGQACAALAPLGEVEPPPPGATRRVLLRTTAGKAAIPSVIRTLDEHGIEVESVVVEEQTLDDVFLAVTGSHLEGAEAEPEPEAVDAA